MNIVDTVCQLFAVAGKNAYFGENVSQTEHALQTAHLAESAGADCCLVTAALLHDVGHLLRGLPQDAAMHGIDDAHETGGAAWLEQYFGDEVTMPIRLHVAAKRYLCAVDLDYHAQLSAASQLSLKVQGGAFDDAEARGFEHTPHAKAAIALRRWDDAAKVPGLSVPDLEHYRSALAEAHARREATHGNAP